VKPSARHVQRDAPAEAVAHRGDAIGIDEWLRFDQVVRCLRAGQLELHVALDRAGELARLAGVVRRLAVAEHVGRERDVPELRHLGRASLDVIVQAPPLVHDDDARPLALGRVVVREEPLERRFALLVLDRLRFDLREGRRGRGEHDEQRARNHHEK
jgi:hypothetical protein